MTQSKLVTPKPRIPKNPMKLSLNVREVADLLKLIRHRSSICLGPTNDAFKCGYRALVREIRYNGHDVEETEETEETEDG